jgi:hypothetical protein
MYYTNIKCTYACACEAVIYKYQMYNLSVQGIWQLCKYIGQFPYLVRLQGKDNLTSAAEFWCRYCPS